MSTLSPEEQRLVALEAFRYANAKPPVIGVVGLSGVGKSSTINRMFGTTLPISHTVACTKALSVNDFELNLREGPAAGQRVRLRVVDAPGLGESISTDPAYLQMYEAHLAACDVVLWIFSATNRAMILDQGYMQRFKRYLPKVVFAVNQVDAVGIDGWNHKINLPTAETKVLIEEIVADRKAKVFEAVGLDAAVIAFSAQHGFRLQKLFRALIAKLPEDRKWLFDNLRVFSYRDFLPTQENDQNA
jgi:uncharacterized protein